jgi:hypothetical protein
MQVPQQFEAGWRHDPGEQREGLKADMRFGVHLSKFDCSPAG